MREFYLNGNLLECRGADEMLKGLAVAAEVEHCRLVEEEKMKALMAAEGALAGEDTLQCV